MSSMKQSLLNGIAKVQAGTPVDSNTLDADNSSSDISSASPDAVESVSASESTVDDVLSGSEDAPTDSSDTTEETQAAPETTEEAKQKTSGTSKEAKEVITISDDKGRRKVEVDFNNRDQLKKYVQMAYGARKWQAERDEARNQLKERDSRDAQKDADWQKLETAFQQGYDVLIDTLAGRQGAFDEFVAQKRQRVELQKNNPEAFAALEAKELADKLAKELEKQKSENEKFKKSVTEDREAAEVKALESRVNPVFQKYRFADKLGNPHNEQMIDEMLWNSAMKRLEPYEEQNLDLTPDIIDKEFRAAAQSIRSVIGTQAEKKAAKVVEQKKQEATENAQAKVMSGYTKGGTHAEAKKLLDAGDIKGIFKNWGNLKTAFDPKKRR